MQDRHSGGGCDRKRGGKHSGISHSPPMTILIFLMAAGFRPLPSQVYVYTKKKYIYIYVVTANMCRGSTPALQSANVLSRICITPRMKSF